MNANTQLNPNLTHVVPLNLLVQSKVNVRKTNAKDGIEGLAANIEALGLRQNLNVRKLSDGTSEVIAGQRRLMALQLLAKQKKIPEDFLVPCLEVKDEQEAKEISIAENVMREAMHPADQFEAFNALVVEGMPIEDVAAKYGVTPAVVKQRMKLATVSPKIVKAFRAGELTLEHVMAFTLTSDKKMQEKVFGEMSEFMDADDIRGELTEGMVDIDRDSAAKLVGIEAYEAAGGEVVRDLFDKESTGYMKDEVLLTKLALEKLAAEAEKVKAEGWKWVEHAPSFDYDYKMGRIHGRRFTKADKERAGARVSISYNGELSIERGLILAADMKAEKAKNAEKRGEPVSGEYAQSQIETLTAHRTAAIRFELTRNVHVAKVAVTHALALSAFYERNWDTSSAMEIHTKPRNLEPLTRDTERDQLTAKEAGEVSKVLRDSLPKKPEQLWDHLLKLDDADLDVVLACAAACTLDAVRTKFPEARKMQNVEEIAAALNLDMTKHWEPKADGFIGRMKKSQMVQALKQAGKADAAFNVEKMKRDAAVKATATALEGTGWLPAMLKPANDNKKAKREKAA
ncbi:ParB family chromosome partitioning protein [Bradyrhizobium sp. LB8.2]|uniref:ParB/RepB/Spo0J family partition protein n=1 Tax=Bradyrhizobium sp. LB8.2 TaxID=3156330 RepID=UPI0033965DD9